MNNNRIKPPAMIEAGILYHLFFQFPVDFYPDDAQIEAWLTTHGFEWSGSESGPGYFNMAWSVTDRTDVSSSSVYDMFAANGAERGVVYQDTPDLYLDDIPGDMFNLADLKVVETVNEEQHTTEQRKKAFGIGAAILAAIKIFGG